MRTSTVFGLLVIAAPALAQYSIDPESVNEALRDKWCDDQTVQCPLICLQLPGITDPEEPISNDCDPATLQYECVCSNNVSPNVTEYSQTIPFYICQEWGNQCVKACGQDNTCSDNCRANHPCGAQNPKRVNSTSTSSAATASATDAAGSAPPTAGFAGATSAPKGKGAASSMLNLGQSYGLAVVFAGIFAGFALVL
jgi:hypothetical protein